MKCPKILSILASRVFGPSWVKIFGIWLEAYRFDVRQHRNYLRVPLMFFDFLIYVNKHKLKVFFHSQQE